MGSHMAHTAEFGEKDVLAHLAKARKPLSLREIAAAMGIRRAGRHILAKMIPRLEKRGEIEEIRTGRYALAKGRAPLPESRQVEHASASSAHVRPARMGRSSSGGRAGAGTITGRLIAHRDGFGFVVPEKPMPGLDGDIFIGASRMGDAMHGDRVEVRIERRKPGDGGGTRAEGTILRVLGRAHATVVGVFQYGAGGNSVAPYESRIAQNIVIPPGGELTAELREKLAGHLPRRGERLPELDGAVVNVEVTRFPTGGMPASGRVVEILGRPGEFGVDVEILIRKHHLPHVFAEDVIAEAHQVAHQVGDAEREGREDFRALPIVTIDGETARDFDDAVYVEPLGGGRWQLQVHIADVSHYVRRDAALDLEARLRGTSVYFPDRAVPMLPEELSNGICSLNPREDRLVMSAIMEIGPDGEIASARVANGVIRSAERMTYTLVNAVLEGEVEAATRYAHLAVHFRNMRELALLLNKRRARLGSIDFDLPEPVIEFDPEGRMTGITRSERNIAHRLIEEFMLAANQAVAGYLDSRGIPSLHRVHEKPDGKKILEFEELAHSFGYSLGIEGLSEKRMPVKHGEVRAPARHGRTGGGRERPMSVSLPGTMDIAILPRHYQQLAQRIVGKPEERIVAYLMLRSLKQARYAAEPLGHFALAFDQYTHFTSPIRRYPDLIVHRILKWALANEKAAPEAQRGPYGMKQLEAIAEETSEAERGAVSAERELMDWKRAQFMEQHLGEEYGALIISVQKFGFFVELVEIFVEGIVSIQRLEELLGVRCYFREIDRAVVCGKPGAKRSRVFKLGERVRVRAERIDPIRRRVEFSPID
jgi:ribonuclease R